VVNPTSQRQSRPRDQPSDEPMTTPSVPEHALALGSRVQRHQYSGDAQPLSSSTHPRTYIPESRGGVSQIAGYTGDRRRGGDPSAGSVGLGGRDWCDLDAEVGREDGYWKLLPSTAR
jgi:hypothetical protein